jgi:DNA-binding IclR family transcriptional regulator
MATTSSPITSVETAFNILARIIDSDGASLGDLSGEFDKPKSTTHGYLKTLMNVGLVKMENGEYRASARLLEMGAQARNQRAIYRAAKPEVDRLAVTTGHMASLMTEERGWGVTLYSAGGLSEIDLNVHPGLHSKLHTTSGGKAILAELNRQRVSEIIDEQRLGARTRHTITDIDELMAELEAIDDRGYAVNSEERVIGMRSYGATVTDRDENPVGALVVFGPATRIDADSNQDRPIPDLLLEAVNIVEVNLNYD